MSFDDKAKEWDKDPKKVERAEVFAGEIVKFIGEKVLNSAIEFGSGTGLVSFHLKERFRSVTLADTSKGMMEVLSEKIASEKAGHFKPFLIEGTADLRSITQADAIYTLLTLHHVRDIDETLSVFSGILKKGGYLFIGDLVTEDGSFHYKDPDFDGHRGFDTADLKEKLERNGFETISDKIILSVEREPGGIKRSYPLFMLASVKK